VGSSRNSGAVFCRSAGTFATIISKDEVGKKVRSVVVKLQSGEIRRVDPHACATVGVASNPHYHFRILGKAGRSRWLNIRPTVRGLAMNACESCPCFLHITSGTNKALQPITLTVVVEGNPREMSTPCLSGAHRQREVSRPGPSAIPTRILCRTG